MEDIIDTKENLAQSIRLLNQETTHRKSLLRLSTKTTTPKRISLQQSVHSRKDADDTLTQLNDIQSPKMSSKNYVNTKIMKAHNYSDLDLSLTIAPHELRDIMVRSEKNDMTMREIMEDSSTTGIILKANEPWREVSMKLYYDFLQCIQAHISELQVFDTIADFIQSCTDTLEIMRGMQAKVENTVLSTEEISLENERNTWRLIYCLYQNRIKASNFDTMMDDNSDVSYISEKNVIDHLYKTEKQVRECQLIIDWLEKNALDQANRLPSIECFTDKTVAWENTLYQLQNRNIGIAFGSSRPLITSMDPDAPIREGKPIHDLDKEDDARLEKRMFIEVRCGRLQKAQALSIHCGQQWRAACLLGWVPHHDPNYTNPLTDTKLPIIGNPNRDLWKQCAWEFSQDKRVGQFYRAIYASLCGNVQQLLQVAMSWQDALWAYMKGLLDVRVEAELRDTMPKNHTPMPEEYWKNSISLEDIFKELNASKNEVIRAQANKPDHLIQKYLILDEIPKLMEEIDTMIDLGTCDSQFLRFLAHLILFLRQIGKNTKDKIGDKVLQAYVKVLIKIGDPILIAFYTAALPQEDQISNYASYLENVTDFEQRKRCLTAAEDANLNVEAITKTVVESIRKKNVEVKSNDLKGTLTDADMEKINALDWVIFYRNQREEALWQTNALIRYFLTNDKIDAARKAFNKIPLDSIESVMSDYPTMENTLTNLTLTDNLSKKAAGTIREFLCYKTYLDAQEGFSEWFSHFHHGKPTPLDDLPAYATFTEKVAYDHKKAQYNIELDRWKCTMQHHTKAVKQLLFNVLLFPDGGWLIDTNKDSDEADVNSDEDVNLDEPSVREEVLREHQLKKLRELCIPKIALLLHTVMSEMNEHADCIQLADILACEQYQLFEVFPKGRLREIFKKICESSLILMDQKKDPWGYPK